MLCLQGHNGRISELRKYRFWYCSTQERSSHPNIAHEARYRWVRYADTAWPGATEYWQRRLYDEYLTVLRTRVRADGVEPTP
jgi:hypothetical protein